MRKYYLAVDIGASSGRLFLGSLENAKIEIEEIHRFSNGVEKQGTVLCWNLDRLFSEILHGLAICKNIGKIPVSIGIDTWAVDYVLLNSKGHRVGRTYAYRDQRTKGMDSIVSSIIPNDELYARTGIQKQIFNTLYQLIALQQKEPEILEGASTLLMIPDYFCYLLTGVKKTEYTNATTTQLVAIESRNWDFWLLEQLGITSSLFTDISPPGTFIGRFSSNVKEYVGYDTDVMQVATHDTASAVVAVPGIESDFVYISSGTWSLMGVEQKEADCSEQSRLENMTNEGGYSYRFRFLKNIMGLWMIQSVRKELNAAYSFDELGLLAAECDGFTSRVNVNDNCFLSPQSMICAIQNFCRETGQPIPVTPGELARVIYTSLAEAYDATLKTIEKLTGKTYNNIHIVGGGAYDDYLNQVTSDITGKTVYAGPTEATAIGNLIVQMIDKNEFKDIYDARQSVRDSFTIRIYKPRGKNELS